VYVGVRPAVELGEEPTGVLFSGHSLDPLERAFCGKTVRKGVRNPIILHVNVIDLCNSIIPNLPLLERRTKRPLSKRLS
jgi:hypothetical protein